MLYVVAPSNLRAQHLRSAIGDSLGLRNLRDVRLVIPALADDMRGRSLHWGDWVAFHSDYIGPSGEPMWGSTESMVIALAISQLRAVERSAADLDGGRLYELIPDVGLPPLDDPVALARWLLA